MRVWRNAPGGDAIRVQVVRALMLLSFVLLLGAMWNTQVAHGQRYRDDLARQTVRRVKLPGVRGQIFDADGDCLADSRPSYNVAVFLEELRQPGRWSNTIGHVNRVLDELAEMVGRPREISHEDLLTHIRKRLPLPLLAWRDLDPAALARFVECTAGLPGVDVDVSPMRVYPYGQMACHVLGYVGRAEPFSPLEETEPYHFYLPEIVGRAGVEQAYDGLLRGEAGGRLLVVDVAGFRRTSLPSRSPRPGGDLKLTIRRQAQEAAEAALGSEIGAIVVLDPSNGDILAMASTPGFNPNLFQPAVSKAVWQALLADPEKPLFNRCLGGEFAPGSIFKPVVALAALENDRSTPQTTFSCPGSFQIGKARFRCWLPSGHGEQDLVQALQHSCNVYFYRLGLSCGHERIVAMARSLGMGQPTDIPLRGEASGLVADDAWKRRIHRDAWRDGDTCNLAIGQGALSATPLQMAVLAGALANGGRLYRPRLVMGVRAPGASQFQELSPVLVRDLHWVPEHIRAVRAGMRAVVMTPDGTGRLASVPGVTMAGKTGTAEIGVKGAGQKLGWMLAFAPFERPRYAVVVLVEQAVSGGTTAAPMMQALMRRLFEHSGGEAEL